MFSATKSKLQKVGCHAKVVEWFTCWVELQLARINKCHNKHITLLLEKESIKQKVIYIIPWVVLI